jgi:hypothetical protein
MEQQLHLRPKLQLSSPHSLGHSTLHDKPAPLHPSIQIEEGDPVTLYSNLRSQSQDDYPDGGLRAWLVVLGVRLLELLSLWTETDHVLGCLCLLFDVSSLWRGAYIRSLVQGTHGC